MALQALTAERYQLRAPHSTLPSRSLQISELVGNAALRSRCVVRTPADSAYSTPCRRALQILRHPAWERVDGRVVHSADSADYTELRTLPLSV